MDRLEREDCIDFDLPTENRDPRFSLEYLWGKALGQMFGILVCTDQDGNEQHLKAFSSQYNSVMHVDGWVDPLFDIDTYNGIMVGGAQEIESIGEEMSHYPKGSERYLILKTKRRRLSQSFQKALHKLYTFHGQNGTVGSLTDAFYPSRGVPTGSGDCCAPKLLNTAAIKGWKPVALAEFYWGETNRSGTRFHKQFYSSCDTRCEPILGFLLCEEK